MSRSANGTAYWLDGLAERPAIVLIHGLGLNQAMWRDCVPSLADHFQVISYDLYGHGDSIAPPSKPSLELFSRQLGELLTELNVDRCAIVGFSLGGMINRRLAMDNPERVKSLIILNSPHERAPKEQQRVETQALQTQQGGPAATLETTLKRWFTPQFLANSPDMIATVRKWVLNNDPQVYAKCRWVLAHGVKELIRPEPPISKPTLVVTCENDSGSTPAMTHAIAAEISNAKTLIVPGLQHLGIIENPALFIQPIVEFLK